MSLIESAKLNGHDPWAYLKDVLERRPTPKDADLATLLPHNWRTPMQARAGQGVTRRKGGSRSFRVECDTLISLWPARTDWPAGG